MGWGACFVSLLVGDITENRCMRMLAILLPLPSSTLETFDILRCHHIPIPPSPRPHCIIPPIARYTSYRALAFPINICIWNCCKPASLFLSVLQETLISKTRSADNNRPIRNFPIASDFPMTLDFPMTSGLPMTLDFRTTPDFLTHVHRFRNHRHVCTVPWDRFSLIKPRWPTPPLSIHRPGFVSQVPAGGPNFQTA